MHMGKWGNGEIIMGVSNHNIAGREQQRTWANGVMGKL